jgi:hypothetical protein
MIGMLHLSGTEFSESSSQKIVANQSREHRGAPTFIGFRQRCALAEIAPPATIVAAERRAVS